MFSQDKVNRLQARLEVVKGYQLEDPDNQVYIDLIEDIEGILKCQEMLRTMKDNNMGYYSC